MTFPDNVYDYNDRIIFSLRSLYSKYGYSRFKMSKFEEYDLYSKNKDFLVSDGVITFTDRNGRLMALKPDVTLSIIKNVGVPAEGVNKLFYNENVYRVTKDSDSYREIMQVGLECLGSVDSPCIGEVLWLAAESLSEITPNWILEVSSLGMVSALTEKISPAKEVRKKLLDCVSGKNVHEISEICANCGGDKVKAKALIDLLSVSGEVDVLPELEKIAAKEGLKKEFNELKSALRVFEGTPLESRIRVDLSAVCDIRYYNGIVFRGFAEGVPDYVLSGGQYDTLLKRLKKSAKAIGFAVYLDRLEFLNKSAPCAKEDVLVVYDKNADPKGLMELVQSFISEGKSVRTTNVIEKDYKGRAVYYPAGSGERK